MKFLNLDFFQSKQRAFEICEEKCFTEEKIFILARMGNTREALQLITEEVVGIL